MPSVLLFRPDAAMTGGVVNYYSVILDKLSEAVQVDAFRVGRRCGRWGHALFYPAQFLFDCLKLLWTALLSRHDVYHFNPSLNRSAFVRDSVLVFLLALFPGRRVLIFFRGWEDDYYQRLLSRPWSRWYFRQFLRRASHILVLASSNRESLLALGVPEEVIEVTSTTFDGALLERSAAALQRREEFTCLFMSRLVERKGIHELLDALVLLRKAGHRVHLVVAGSGPAENGVREHVAREQLEEWVSLPGYVRASDKAGVLQAADVFLLPTYHGEGCPNCILEAMGAGLPVITTRVGGIPDIIADPANGTLLDGVTPESIAAAIAAYLDNPQRCAEVAETNRQQAWARYEARVVARNLEMVYANVAAMPLRSV